MGNINTLAIQGVLFGDEGKGKIVEILSKDADYIVKFIGGANAGHSVFINDEKVKLNLLPAGIVNKNAKYIFSSGVAIDLKILFEEIDKLKTRGYNVENIYIDERASIVMPYHREIDKVKKQELIKNGIEFSKNGIGPCYNDKISRIGIRAADLLNFSKFEDKVSRILMEKNNILEKYNFPKISKDEILKQYSEYASKVKDMVIDTTLLLNEEILKGSKIIFEGSSGMMLDIDYGTYPSVSSTSLTTGTLCSSSGIAPNKLKDIYGVMKSYVTREDDGLLLTELNEEEEKHFKKNNNEYIANKEKYRRCGWLDLVLVKHSIMLNGINHIALTKLDILSKLKEIKLAVAYDINGKIYQTYPGIELEKDEVEVLYKVFPGWDDDLSKIQKYEDLPQNTKNFIEFIEGYIDVPINIISLGPNPKEVIIK